jgi:hypothetical protein
LAGADDPLDGVGLLGAGWGVGLLWLRGGRPWLGAGAGGWLCGVGALGAGVAVGAGELLGGAG